MNSISHKREGVKPVMKRQGSREKSCGDKLAGGLLKGKKSRIDIRFGPTHKGFLVKGSFGKHHVLHSLLESF